MSLVETLVFTEGTTARSSSSGGAGPHTPVLPIEVSFTNAPRWLSQLRPEIDVTAVFGRATVLGAGFGAGFLGASCPRSTWHNAEAHNKAASALRHPDL